MEQNTSLSDPKHRITMIDALRGFSLLGILLIHMNQHYGIFSFGMMGQGQESPFPAFDSAVQWLSQNVIMGKFINIFAFLFGLSFFIQMDRAAQKGIDFRKRFLWRMAILFVIGIVGNCFYTGDILSIYAVFGAIMVFLFRFKNKILMLIVALLLFGVPRMLLSTYDKLVKTEQVENGPDGQNPGGHGFNPGQMPGGRPDGMPGEGFPERNAAPGGEDIQPVAGNGGGAPVVATPPAGNNVRSGGMNFGGQNSRGGQRSGNRSVGAQMVVGQSRLMSGGQQGGNRQRNGQTAGGQNRNQSVGGQQGGQDRGQMPDMQQGGNGGNERQRHQQVAGDSVRQRPFSPMDTTQVGREARRARRQQALSEGGQRRFEQGDSLRRERAFPMDSLARDSMRRNWEKDGRPDFRRGERGDFSRFEMEKPTFFKSVYNNLTSGMRMKLNYQFGTFGRGYITFALFILGLVIGRSRFFEEAQTRKGRNMVIFAGFVIALLSLKYIMSLFPQEAAPAMFGNFGNNAQSPSYILLALENIYNVCFSGALAMGFIVLYQLRGIGRCLDVMTPYGRMGLTNYVSQSIIGSIIFSMWGFGAIFGGWSAGQLFILALAIYSVQIIISKYWLKYYLYGPFEWLWRSATYMKWQPFKK